MSHYELTDLFYNHFSLSVAIFMAFVSATSALLGIAFFASHLIPKILVRVVMLTYVTTSVFLISAFQRNAELMIVIRDQMKEIKWHLAVSEPAWIMIYGVGVGLVTMIMISVGAVWYFYYSAANSRNEKSSVATAGVD